MAKQYVVASLGHHFFPTWLNLTAGKHRLFVCFLGMLLAEAEHATPANWGTEPGCKTPGVLAIPFRRNIGTMSVTCLVCQNCLLK